MKTRPTPRPMQPSVIRAMRQVSDALAGERPVPPARMTDAQLDQWKLDSWNRSRRLRAMHSGPLSQRTQTRLAALATVAIVILVAWGIGLLIGQYLTP